jgi:heptosyltransferase-2
VDLAGRTNLRELMAVLAECRLLLTNDTGPMHVAAALGVPVVVPFGSTSPELTGPGLPGDPRHRWIRAGAGCAPCFLRECPIDFRCMHGIGVDHVAGVVRGVLAEAAGHDPCEVG